MAHLSCAPLPSPTRHLPLPRALQPLQRKIRYLATIRNKLVHERNFHQIPVRGVGLEHRNLCEIGAPSWELRSWHGEGRGEAAAVAPPVAALSLWDSALPLLQDRQRFVENYQSSEQELRAVVARYGRTQQGGKPDDVCRMM